MINKPKVLIYNCGVNYNFNNEEFISNTNFINDFNKIVDTVFINDLNDLDIQSINFEIDGILLSNKFSDFIDKDIYISNEYIREYLLENSTDIFIKTVLEKYPHIAIEFISRLKKVSILM